MNALLRLFGAIGIAEEDVNAAWAEAKKDHPELDQQAFNVFAANLKAAVDKDTPPQVLSALVASQWNELRSGKPGFDAHSAFGG
jgi:hypothetical protein